MSGCSDESDAQSARDRECARGQQVIEGSDFFAPRESESRQDIADAVWEYNEMHYRRYRAAESNKRRYKAVCVVQDCAFVVQFVFIRQFKSPGLFRPHSCSALQLDVSTRAANRSRHATQIARKPEVRDLFVTYGRYVSPRMIQSVMLKTGGTATYKKRLNAKKRLMAEFFRHELKQYKLSPLYIDKLRERHHKCKIDVAAGVFARLTIVYREGTQAFGPYANRGLAVDGTFLKTSEGGMLLVACFKNGNNKIRIVSIGVVSIENEDN